MVVRRVKGGSILAWSGCAVAPELSSHHPGLWTQIGHLIASSPPLEAPRRQRGRFARVNRAPSPISERLGMPSWAENWGRFVQKLLES
jgi:hypothetical protein